MIPVTTFAGQDGRAVRARRLGARDGAGACRPAGRDVVAWDDNPAKMARGATRRASRPPTCATPTGRGFAALVLSPGVPLTHPEPHWTATLAKAAGVEIIGDIELFCRERATIAPDAPFVAITGTNGKSTTTALIAHILREAGRDVQMGGNIGTAILSLEPPADGSHPRRSSARRSRSTSRRRSRPTSASCSTSRRTTSTGTGRWSTTPPSRSGWSPGRSSP